MTRPASRLAAHVEVKLMSNYKASIINQSLTDVPTMIIYKGNAACSQPSDKPSRFRRKKGYTGKTAQSCNKNFETMPEDF